MILQSFASIAEAWANQGRTGAIARVIGAQGLGPRPIDDMLLVDSNDRTGGTLLGGVIQPEVITAARQLLTSDDSQIVVALDVDSADATAAGLTCGGVVDVLVQRFELVPREL